VATRISSHTQLLDDGLAFLVEPTAGGLAGGIEQALRAPAEAAARARRGRELVEREYSAARHAEKVRDAYAAIAAGLAARRPNAPC
jgi:glycosyltransferase involved in cell wall biosynthesis